MRFLTAALFTLATCAGLAYAQDPTPPEDKAPSGEEQAAAENAEQTKAEQEQAGDEANLAVAALEQSRIAMNNAKGAFEVAKAKQKAAEEALAKATADLEAAKAAAAAGKEAAEAEGAPPEAATKAQALGEAVKAAEQALTAAIDARDAATKAAEEAESKADATQEAYEAAESESKAKDELKATAEKKQKAADAAQAAMERAKNEKRGPAMEIDVLKLRIKPLTQEELKVEADEWIKVLKAKATGISYATIALKHASEEDKAVLTEALTALRSDRTAMIDRVTVVLQGYTAKGGDATQYESYLEAITGIEIAPNDVGAAWGAITGWLQDGQGGLRWGRNLIFFLLTLLLFKFLSAIVGKVVATALRAARVKTSGLLKDFFVNASRKIVFFIGIVMALSMLEVNIGPFLAAMGGVAFVVGFALQGTLSNFAAGIMILTYRPYDIGDLVQVSGATGVVHAMSLVSTSLTTADNQIVIIPNGSIWGGIITNKTGLKQRRVDLTIGIGYDDDVAKAEAVLTEIVTSHEKVLKTPAPVIKLHELGDSSVNFVVRPWCKTSDYWDVHWDLTRAIKDRFDAEADLGFPYPTQDINVTQTAAAAS